MQLLETVEEIVGIPSTSLAFKTRREQFIHNKLFHRQRRGAVNVDQIRQPNEHLPKNNLEAIANFTQKLIDCIVTKDKIYLTNRYGRRDLEILFSQGT